MKKGYIKIAGKDFAPILVGFGESCLNCDVKLKECWCQCNEMEENDNENVALKMVRHEVPPTAFKKFLGRLKKFFKPIESELPF